MWLKLEYLYRGTKSTKIHNELGFACLCTKTLFIYECIRAMLIYQCTSSAARNILANPAILQCILSGVMPLAGADYKRVFTSEYCSNARECALT